jgi:phenylalanyl-tRNA synthetase beta chain
VKLPILWLKKYIDVKMPVEKLAEKLTLSGNKVESVKNPSADAVIEIEVTSNRPDCLSVLGLAQEVAAFTGRRVRFPEAYRRNESPARPKKENIFDIHVEDKKGCPRYTGRVIRNVRVAPAPSEAQRFLSSVGTRTISNIVDATNYVLFECGQPMHVFDLDKIRGGRIHVRRSKANEKFLGLDGIEHTLDDKTLVIADSERVIAIAGVLGGKLTEVTEVTKNILLESAYFDPIPVRQASKKYKITTESSYRFERGVNPENVGRASKRASELILEWAHGEDVSGLLDKNYLPAKKSKSIVLRSQRMEKILGLKVPLNRAAQILKNLSFQTTRSGRDNLKVKLISSRRDVTKEIDLIEEVLRIEGFDKVGHRLPPSRYTFEDLRDRKAMGLFRLKRYLASIGLDEIMTHSLLSGKKLSDTGFDLSDCHKVVNPVSAEQEYIRPNLLAGMLEALLFNIHRKATLLKFFELGNRYQHGREETALSLALYGPSEENWAKKYPSSFYDLKGVLENVMDHLRMHAFEWTPSSSNPALVAGSDLLWEGQKIASLGEVSDAIRGRWDIPHEVFYAEIVLEKVFEARHEIMKVRPVAKFPAVRRDIAFIIDNRVSVKDLESAMRSAASPYLYSTTLFDQFVGKNIPAGKRSLAFSLSYQKEDGTFTDDEIQALQQTLGDNLKRLYQVEFR